MFFYLTGAIKRKIIRELKFCFSHLFPEHKDILEYINHKYAFKNRPQKGIIVSGVSASPMRLSSDNFVGTVVSHVMLANLDGRQGLSIEWVREDLRRIDQNGGHFPSPPGIYYIEVYDREATKEVLGDSKWEALVARYGGEEFEHYFFVDPLLTRTEVPLAVGEDNTSLIGEKVLPGTLRLQVNRETLLTGPNLYLEGEKPFEIIGEHVRLLGITPYQKSWSRLTIEGKDEYELGDNSVLVIEAFGQEEITIEFEGPDLPDNPPKYSTQKVVDTIRKKMGEHLYHEDFRIRENLRGDIVIESKHSLEVLGGTANSELGLETGEKAPYVIEGDVFHSYVEEEIEIGIRVQGEQGPFDMVSIYTGQQEPEEIAALIRSLNILGNVEAREAGDYVVEDYEAGEIRFLRKFPSGTTVRASYKSPVGEEDNENSGPFGIKKDHSNNQAIPGVVMAFGRRVTAGDKMAVVVHDHRIPVAAEYGGRWEMGVDLDIITRDPMVREELSDMILMYFFAIRKERLTEEGLEITDVSFGGESEEVYDDTAQDYYFNSQISISFQTDWAIHVPYPLYIERVEQSSFESESAFAGEEESAPLDIFRQVEQDEFNLRRMGQMYLKGKSRDFERIR